MQEEYGFFERKKKKMVESMKSLESTFKTYQNLLKINIVANAISEIAEHDPKLLAMIAINGYSPEQILNYSISRHPQNIAWKYLEENYKKLFDEHSNLPYQVNAKFFDLDKEDNRKIFDAMLYSMSTSRPDLSGNKKIKVVMSGGGAKGFAHVGMLKAFRDHGLYSEIDTVAGTSAGGLIAGLAALGFSPEKMEQIVHEKDFSGFIYEFKSILSKVAHVASPLTSSHRLLRNVAFLNEFSKFMLKELADYAITNPDVSEWERKLLLEAKEKGLGDLESTFTSLLTDYHSQEDMLFMIDKMDKRWMQEVTEKCTDLAEKSLGVQRPEDNTNNPLYQLTKLTPKNAWYGMSPYMKFSNPRDALITSMNIITKRDTVKAFMGRLIYEKIKELSIRCDEDPGMKRRFIAAMTGKMPPENEINWPKISDYAIANVTFVQLERLRENFPEEGFKKLVLTFCERDGTILNKNNITPVTVDADSEKYGNMKIVDAMCATMRLPIVFSPYVFEEPVPLSKSELPENNLVKELDRYFDHSSPEETAKKPKLIKVADGGLLQNFPMKSVEDNTLEPRQVVGFFLVPEQNFLAAEHVNELSNPRHAVENPGENAVIKFLRDQKQGTDYLKEKIHGDKQVSKYTLTPDQQIRVGAINVKEIGTVDFNMNSVQKTELMEAGYDTAERILSQQGNGLLYDINTAFWAEKFMAKINQFNKEGYADLLENEELKDRWESIQKLRNRVGITTAPGLSI